MKSNIFSKLNGDKLKIAIVRARFNSQITDKLAQGALAALKLAGVKSANISVHETPGSFEIPLVCQKLARTRKYHGIITIGAIIKGETAHFEYISQAAIGGVTQVMLAERLPITLGIITTYNLRQAQARCRADQANKGYEAALALVEMILNYK
ncbi:MAG: 6,7-dimethyl-8-ribityllumazine synthase [bacterium]|nr:6,7-dimethyl-8-ribityllumazine synthase [bacterium]